MYIGTKYELHRLCYTLWEWVSELLFSAKLAIFELYYGENKAHFAKLMMMSPLSGLVGFYSASSLKQRPSIGHVAPLGHIVLIHIYPIFAISPYCCMLIGEATNTNFIVFDLPYRDSNSRYTAIEASMLTITPPMRFSL